MKRAAFVALLAVLVPLQASALETDELLGLVAMPLAVAAVSDVTGVPVGDLSHLVATLNRANVPPTQFVQVIRYAPVALVVEEPRPTFVEYVDQQVDDGISGTRLVAVIEDRYDSYDVTPRFVTLQEPATTYVLRDDYIPPAVVTRVSEVGPAYYVADGNDLLSLIAMPLAVAAVSNLAGVPVNDLTSLMASLNAARVPPLQVVEVLRYAPAALVVDHGDPRFVRFVETQVVNGVRGPALVEVIDRRLRTYDVTPRFEYVRGPEVIVEETFFPTVVRTRVAEARTHPHGGPPGQLKKELGLQTGAEVVHGTRPRVDDDRDRAVRTRRVERDRPVRVTDNRARVKQRRDSDDRRVVRERRQPSERVRHEPRSERRVTSSQRPERREWKKGERPRSERTKADRAQRGKGGGKGKGKGKG